MLMEIVGIMVIVGGTIIMTVVARCQPELILWRNEVYNRNTKVSATAHQDQGATHVIGTDNIKGLMMIIASSLSWHCFYIVQVVATWYASEQRSTGSSIKDATLDTS
nr:hypothetical protein [Tanacetum cinerariifolium]